MRKRPITSLVIASENIKRDRFRTMGLLVTVACFSFSVLFGSVLVGSLRNGIDTMAGRIGADLMVVPAGSASDFKGTLLRSEPSTFYLREDMPNRVAALQGVEQASPQLYIASLNAECCTVPVQLIGFDPKTDFAVKSWLLNVWDGSLGEDEIVIGNLILAEPGDTLVFFNISYKVVAKLGATGMGLDSSVLMNEHAAQQMIAASGQKVPDTLSGGDGLISAVMVKLNAGADAEDVAAQIKRIDLSTEVIVSDGLMRDISQKLGSISGLTFGITVLLWIVAVFVLFFVFSIVLHARKKEFGLLISLGATHAKIAAVLFYETLIVSVIGAVCGILTACLILFPFQTWIANSMELPYLTQPFDALLGSFLLAAGTSVLIGPVAGLYSIIKISKTDAYSLIREAES